MAAFSEWPAQRAMLGDVAGMSFLDLGCGNGGKLIELMGDGAAPQPAATRIATHASGPVRFESSPGLADRTFDRIMFLQSFGYAADPVRTLGAARAMLANDRFILLTRTQPIRYALERAESNGTT